MKTKKITLQDKYNNLERELEYSRQAYVLLKVELETIKKYTLQPVVSLQIALEKTVDCVAHVLTDLKSIKERR